MENAPFGYADLDADLCKLLISKTDKIVLLGVDKAKGKMNLIVLLLSATHCWRGVSRKCK
jgi:hypothetical protein